MLARWWVPDNYCQILQQRLYNDDPPFVIATLYIGEMVYR